MKEARYRNLYEMYVDLKCDKDETESQLKASIDEMEKEKQYAISSKEAQLKQESDKWTDYSNYIKVHYEEAARQVEEEHSVELGKLHAKLENVTRNQIDKSHLEAKTKQIVDLRREVDVLREELQIQKKEYLAQIAEKDVQSAERLVNETKALVQENGALKEKLNEKTMEAVHFARETEKIGNERRILGYQLSETKERLGPLDRDIALLQKQTEAYERERMQNAETIASLKRKLADVINRLKSSKKQLEQQRNTVTDRDKLIGRITQDIFEMVHSRNTADDDIRVSLLSLYDKYVAGTDNEEILRDPDNFVLDESETPISFSKKLPVMEFARQRATLQRVATSLSANMKRAQKKIEHNRKAYIEENAQLLKENKILRRRVQATEQEIKGLRAAKAFESFKKKPPGTSPARSRNNKTKVGITASLVGEDSRPATSQAKQRLHKIPGSIQDADTESEARQKITVKRTNNNLSTDWMDRNTFRPSSRSVKRL